MDSLREMEGFGVSGKAAKQGRSGVAVGADESLTWKMMMTRRMASQDDRSRPFAPPNQAGIADGPTCNSNSRPKPSISIPSPAGGGEGEFLLQPFQFDISSTTAHTHIPFKSPEVMSLEFPFTRAQWKELERQTIIYKYMVASLPVPPHLLNPIAKSLPASAASHPLLGNGLNLRLSGRGGDVEPGRCRRTDGKKWRCSRDVAPDQKYCERHMHRGRPRSRKHVELLPPKKTRHSTNPPPELASSPSPSTIDFTNNIGPASHQVVSSLPQPLYHNQASERAAIFGSVVSSVSSQKEPRSLEWMMNGEPIPLHDDEHPSLNSLASFSSGEDQQTNTWPLFFNLDTAPLSYSDRGFIDAWSGAAASVNTTPDLGARNSVSSNGNLCLAPLSLTVGGKDAIDDEMGSVGISQPDHHGVGAKSNVSSWLSPASWAASSPGGPLAEVLRPRQVAAAIGATSDPASPIAAEGTSCSPAATAGSSPSGVLQRALASLSDSSGSNSPTPGSSGAKPDIGLVWLSHGKLASSS